MAEPTGPRSLAAERAVRSLRRADGPISSIDLAREVLALDGADEVVARQLLESAFGADSRLRWTPDGWVLSDGLAPPIASTPFADAPLDTPIETPARSEKNTPERDRAPGHDLAEPPPRDPTRRTFPGPPDPGGDAELEPDRVILVLRGEAVRGEPYQLHSFSMVRLREGTVLSACAGTTAERADYLLRAARETIDGAMIVCHDTQGAFRAFERWLDHPLDAPLSLRALAHDRLKLPARHDWETLAAELGLRWRETDDALELSEAYDAALQALRRDGEGLRDMQASLSPRPPVRWERLAFTPQDLDAIPNVPGTYRFFDRERNLLYVGKSKELGRRVRSYFRDRTRPSDRVAPWIESVHHSRSRTSGSSWKRCCAKRDRSARNSPPRTSSATFTRDRGRGQRLASVLILEPGDGTMVLRAYLIREGRWIGSVGIGPRGGG